MSRKFKIGDRVVFKDTGTHGKIKYYDDIWDNYCVTLDDGRTMDWVYAGQLELERLQNTENFKVIITGNNDVTTTRYYKNNKLERSFDIKRDNDDVYGDSIAVMKSIKKLFPESANKTDCESEKNKIESAGYMKLYAKEGMAEFEGYTGLPTDLKTLSGEPLYTGDTVRVYAKRLIKEVNGNTYVYIEAMGNGEEVPVVRPADKARVFGLPDLGHLCYVRVHKYSDMVGRVIDVYNGKIKYVGGNSK